MAALECVSLLCGRTCVRYCSKQEVIVATPKPHFLDKSQLPGCFLKLLFGGIPVWIFLSSSMSLEPDWSQYESVYLRCHSRTSMAVVELVSTWRKYSLAVLRMCWRTLSPTSRDSSPRFKLARIRVCQPQITIRSKSLSNLKIKNLWKKWVHNTQEVLLLMNFPLLVYFSLLSTTFPFPYPFPSPLQAYSKLTLALPVCEFCMYL